MDTMTLSSSFHSIVSVIILLIGFITSQKQSGFFRCRWYTYTESVSDPRSHGEQSKVSATPVHSSLDGLHRVFVARSRGSLNCHERLNVASFQKHCDTDRASRASCGNNVSWTCGAVVDICRKISVSQSPQTDERNEKNNTQKADRIVKDCRNNATSTEQIGEITSAILAFLLGIASATICLMVLSWRRTLFCFKKEKCKRPKSEDSGVYKDGSEPQVSVSTLSTSQIQNPNYCGEGRTSSSPSNLDGPYKQETTRSKSNCFYEELQYAEAGTLVVREPETTDTARSASYAEAGTLVVREPERTDTARSASYAEAGTLVVREPERTATARSASYAEAGTLVVREPERTDTARSASYAEAGTLVVREPERTDTARSASYAEAGTLVVREPERTDTARSASYKYMDMTTPTNSMELSATLPVRAFDSSVQYSVVRKEN